MLFIFDWDGTISDSTGRIVSCMQEAARLAELPVLESDVIQDVIGLGLKEAMLKLYPSVDDWQLDALRDRYRGCFQAADQTPSPFFTGVMDTLQSLKADGHLLAVATGKSRQGLNRAFGHLNLSDFFHGSRCADETLSKPDPLMLLELLGEFEVSVDESVMVGDTEYDMAMAENAGIRSIAVSYGAHHISRLQRYNPVLCVDEFAEIKHWAGVGKVLV